MRNIYIEKIKGIMQRFLANQKIRSEKITKNSEYYSNSVATKMNADITGESEAEYQKAVNEINDIFKTLKNKLAVLVFPNADNITDDIKLFENLTLTRSEIFDIIAKYRKLNNFTMLRFIRETIDNNARFDNDFELKAIIPTADEVINAYKQVFQSALNVLGAIKNNSNTNIDDFAAKPGLFDILGTGGIIEDMTQNPEIHTFDNVFLIKQYGNSFEELK